MREEKKRRRKETKRKVTKRKVNETNLKTNVAQNDRSLRICKSSVLQIQWNVTYSMKDIQLKDAV